VTILVNRLDQERSHRVHYVGARRYHLGSMMTS